MASADTADKEEDVVVEKGRAIELNKRKELQMDRDRFIQYDELGKETLRCKLANRPKGSIQDEVLMNSSPVGVRAALSLCSVVYRKSPPSKIWKIDFAFFSISKFKFLAPRLTNMMQSCFDRDSTWTSSFPSLQLATTDDPR
jgi:hypothetical protein